MAIRLSQLKSRPRSRGLALIGTAFIAAAVLLAAGAAVAVGEERLGRSVSTGPPTFPPTGAKLAVLRKVAVAGSSEPGDARVARASVFLSTHAAAVETVGGSPTFIDDRPVYVIAMRGQFSTAGISSPPKKPHTLRPFSPSITLIVDAETDELINVAQGDVRDLSALGPSIQVDLNF